MMGDSDGLEPGIHAEHNALLKLKPIKLSLGINCEVFKLLLLLLLPII